ncbi:MAG TPA: TonB-dependent receptor [Candidatus Limnocylindrales bacterium]|nr:TonB-dependent receptor [Candidatus Limnocylindrales bacterium]
MRRPYAVSVAVKLPALMAALLLFLSLSAFADGPTRIHGTVKDPRGAVIPNAQVELFKQGRKIASGVTDQAGNYSFSDLPAGDYEVRAAAAGFSARQSGPVHLGVSGASAVDFFLAVEAIPEHIVVSATGIPVPESQVGAAVSVITREEFQDRMDILEPLEQAPGAQIVQSGQRGAATSLFVRGGNSNANKVLLDGVSLNDIGGVVNFGTLATTGVEQMEVLRGPNSVLYGPDAVAGVVSLTTRRGATRRPEISYSFDAGNFGALHHDVSLGGVFRRLDYLGEFSRSDTNNSLPNSTFHNGTYVANLGLALNATTEARFTGRYTTAALGQPNAIDFFGIADDSFQRDQDAYFSATLQNQTTERWHNLLRYGGTRLRLQDENPLPTGIPFDNGFGFGLNFLGRPVTIRGANGFSVTGQAILDFGGDYPALTGSSSKRDSVYLQSDYSFNPHLTALAAFRFEQERGFTLAFGSSTPADRNNFSYIAEIHGSLGSRAYAALGGSVEKNAVFGTAAIPRVSVAYYVVRPNSGGPLNGTKLKANYGQGIKEPSIFEESASLFGLLSQLSGGPQLISQFRVGPIGAERSRSYDFGVEQMAANDRLKISATFFHNQFTNQIEFVPNTALPLLGVPAAVAAQAGFGATVNSGDTRALGAEVEVAANLGHGFTARAGYTYLDEVVERSFTNDAFSCSSSSPSPSCFNPAFPGIPIGAFAPLVGSRPFRRAPHTGYFFAGYSRARFDLSINGYLVSRRDDSTFLSDGFFGTTMLLPNRNLAPAFEKIDVGGSYRINPRLRVFTVMENVASQHYDPVFGFPALPFSFRTGLKVTLGGESWK